MNTSLRVFCAAWLLVTVMPTLAAQQPAKKAPPAAPPAAGQARDEPAESSTKAAQLKRELDQRLEAIRTYSAGRRSEALADARRVVDDLDRQMERLQQQTDHAWARMSQASRSRSQATMADLRQRRNALAEWVGGMRHGSAAAWGEVRGGFVKSYHELADAIRKARDELDKSRDKEKGKDKANKTEGGSKP